MGFTSLFLFFFGAIGVFNSFLISLYFILKKGKQKSNLLFGLFLFFISERALRSLIYFFSPALPNFYTQSEAISFVFIGPFLLLYIVSIIRPKSKLISKWVYYVLGWILIAITSHLVFPFKGNQVAWTKYILFTINMQWLFHILISGVLFFMYINKLSLKNDKKHPINLWIGLLLISVTLLWLLYFFVSFSYFVIGSITFSALFYSFFLYFVFNKKARTKVFPIQKKYIIEKIDNPTKTVIVKKLNTLMIEQKLYKNANLKLKDLAECLELSSHQISQLLNDNLGKSFSEFINEHRIEEAKRLIQSNTRYTLEAIGNESGFNSKSMFYKYFKNVTGMTPKKYKEDISSS